MAILRNILILCLPFILCGCYEEFTPEIDIKPVLCMNSLITAGEPIEVKLSHTWLFNDETVEADHAVEDAMLSIFVNNEPMPEGYIAKEGDEIHLLATSPVYGSAEATVRVPYAVPISSGTIRCEKLELLEYWDDIWGGSADLTFNTYITLAIEDDADTDNYFRLNYFWMSPSSDNPDEQGMNGTCYYEAGSFDYNAEPLFKEHIGVFESVVSDSFAYMLFSDKQFNGKTYTMNLNLNRSFYGVTLPVADERLFDCELSFILETISVSYYDRGIYLWHRDSGSLGDFSAIGLADPMWGYGNVSSGAGIVAARVSKEYRFSLKDFLKMEINGRE